MRTFAGGFPKLGLYAFGVLYTISGVIQFILGFVMLGLMGRDVNDFWKPTPSRYELYAFYPGAAVVFSACVLVITGVLGIIAPNLNNPHRQAAMVSGFKLLTISCSMIFGPLLFGIGLTTAHLLDMDTNIGAVGLVVCVVGGIQTLIIWVAACMTCCYSPYSYDPYGDYPRGNGPEPPRYRYDGPPSYTYKGRDWPRRF